MPASDATSATGPAGASAPQLPPADSIQGAVVVEALKSAFGLPARSINELQDEYEVAREGIPTGADYEMTDEERAARDKNNLAVAGGVIFFILIVFATTVFRLVQNAGAEGAVGQ